MATVNHTMLPDGQKDLTRRTALAALSATPLAMLLPEVANDALTALGSDHLPHPVLALPPGDAPWDPDDPTGRRENAGRVGMCEGEVVELADYIGSHP